MALSAGMSLGPYRVVGSLGAGGMGEVYRAHDARLGRDVALKVLSGDLGADRQRLHRFEREARVVSSLSHPNIVTVYEIGEVGGSSYIAMELVEGQTLRQLLRSDGLPTRRLLDLATQIAGGLARAHDAGIVHRDLKPENVMVTSGGVVKILDFGLAKLTRSFLERGAEAQDGTLPLPTEPGVLLGTVRYMSPEQASGLAADFRSDQFSFGSVAYELATGESAFQKPTTVDTLSAILHDEPAPIAQRNPKVPAPLRWIIERCLAKDPRDRYASTQDLARDLSSLRVHLSDLSGISGISGAPRMPSRRRAIARAALAVATVAAVAVAYVLGERRTHGPAPQFHQLTFQSAGIASARFTPDGQTVVYSAQWDGKRPELYETRIDHPQARSLGLPSAQVLSISRSGFMAVLLLPSYGTTLRPPHSGSVERYWPYLLGTLAQVPLLGGAPRELLDGVLYADWAPNGKDLAVTRYTDGNNHIEFPIGKVVYQHYGPLNFVRVAPSGDRLAFSNLGACLMTTDPSGKVTETDAKVWEKAWSPLTGELWYSDPASGTTRLRALAPSGRDRVVATLAGDFTLYDIASNGDVLLGQVMETEEIFQSRAGEAKDRLLFSNAELKDVSPSGDTITYAEVSADSPSAYLAKTDGSPVKRLDALGGYEGAMLSPDGQFVIGASSPDGLAVTDTDSALVFVPAGAGASRIVSTKGVMNQGPVGMSRDGKRIYIHGAEEGHGRRLWVQDMDSGTRRPISREGVGRASLSPDERYVVATDRTGWKLYPTEGSEVLEVRGLGLGEEPIQWTGDGKALYVRASDELQPGDTRVMARVYRLDPWTGRRELYKEIAPISPLTGGGIGTIRFSADGKICFYNHLRYSSELIVASGLR